MSLDKWRSLKWPEGAISTSLCLIPMMCLSLIQVTRTIFISLHLFSLTLISVLASCSFIFPPPLCSLCSLCSLSALTLLLPFLASFLCLSIFWLSEQLQDMKFLPGLEKVQVHKSESLLCNMRRSAQEILFLVIATKILSGLSSSLQ